MKGHVSTSILMTALASFGMEVASQLPSASSLAQAQTVGKDGVDELMGQLGSDRFEVREAATRALMDRSEAAPALRKALNSPDAEVARRAAQILKSLDQREDHQFLQRLRKLAGEGEVDQVVQCLVSRGQAGDKEGRWQCITEVAGRLAFCANRDFGRAIFLDGLPLPIQKPQLYAREVYPGAIISRHPIVRGNGTYLLQGEEVDVQADTAFDLIISSGRVRTGRLASSVIFSGNSVELDSGVSCMVVCDGEFTARQGMGHSLIISRGPVNCPSEFYDCFVVTGQRMHVAKGPNAQVRNGKVVENETTPCGFLKFFDPARVGIEVEATRGEVRISRIQKETTFGRAGFRTGDVLVTVDGAKVTSPESFRRILRKLWAERREAVFCVRRLNSYSELRVLCQE